MQHEDSSAPIGPHGTKGLRTISSVITDPAHPQHQPHARHCLKAIRSSLIPAGPHDIPGFQTNLSDMLYTGAYPRSITPNILKALRQFTKYILTHSTCTKQSHLDRHYHHKCIRHPALCAIFPVVKQARSDDPEDQPKRASLPSAVKRLAKALQHNLNERALALQRVISTVIALHN